MNALREAAQRLLEGVSNALPYAPHRAEFDAVADAADDLRAALAEPTCKDDLQVEPVAWMDVDDRGNMLSLRFWSEGGHEEVPLYTHPAPQRQPQEPVAGVVLNEEGRPALVEHGQEDWHCANRKARRLYTHPAPQRQPHEPSREMLEALQIIATPQRPDGTWNRDREACRQLAAEALGFHNKGEWK